MSKLEAIDQLFEGHHFDREVIVLCQVEHNLLNLHAICKHRWNLRLMIEFDLETVLP